MSKGSIGEPSFALFAQGLRDLRRKTADPRKIEQLLAALSEEQAEFFLHDWPLWARSEQLPPDGGWTTWLFMGGRGAGKTRAGAEWVRGLALGQEPFAHEPLGRIALIGETYDDARDVMVEGVSGILSVHPRFERPSFEKTRGQLTWPNGSIAQIFSAEDPDGLRGPQFHAAWCDEFSKWRYMQTWDNLQFGLRLGEHPRALITTTPRPLPLLKKLLSDGSVAITRASTSANADNLSPVFLKQIAARYEGTKLGRQEFDGELIEDRDDSLFTRAIIDSARVSFAPQLSRIVVALDPAVTSSKRADACGLIAAGKGEDGHAYVLEDATLRAVRPDVWAARAIALYKRLEADCLIAEVNQGGEVITSVINAIDPSVPVTTVHATRGKFLRAEPVAALYAKGLVHHVGSFAALEDEMCDFGHDGLSGGRSPDRLDALVWAVTALKLDAAKPLIRRL
jgi:phage terminase large subunit-like protein